MKYCCAGPRTPESRTLVKTESAGHSTVTENPAIPNSLYLSVSVCFSLYSSRY
ncbi:hypothetical protein M407DRAFT_243417, partial [Tulasnella calospora MUT 4182]